MKSLPRPLSISMVDAQLPRKTEHNEREEEDGKEEEVKEEGEVGVACIVILFFCDCYQ